MIRPQLKAGQEWVWDYPRPPRMEPLARRVRVEFGGLVIAQSWRALRILETSHPPTIYIPRADVRTDSLQAAPGSSFCEWKGFATYFDVRDDGRESTSAAWTYEQPSPTYGALAQHIAFYPSRVDACFIDDERVDAQQGDFYGGWITANIIGPFKGAAGTRGW